MSEMSQLVKKQKQFYFSGETKDINFRLNALNKFKNAIIENESKINAALKEDLNKSVTDTYLSEIGFVLQEISDITKGLHSWVKPKRVKTPISHFGSSSYRLPEPYGVTLTIAPWNYPFQLAVAPILGAIAAGNTVILKPSELTPAVSHLLKELISSTFDENYIAVVEGGVETSTQLLKEPFDYIFFTGSVPVGKIVMEAASKNLTPITLELGGKSPVIVDETANLKLAAKRIVWGKFFNAGQTCVAPDYMLVHHSIKDELMIKMKETIKEFYTEQPLSNENYTHIVNVRHFNRLASYLTDGKIVQGGKVNNDLHVIEPTIIDEITWDDPIMQDEIFGPILPVMEYNNVDEIINMINNRPKPLALYVFSESKQIQDQIINNVSYGGGCINDTMYHIATPHLPFGGVGHSGVGAYHGKHSFETFSHIKSILKQTTLFDLPFRYPTMKNGLKYAKKIFK
ncbi:aldehyde dehydrogenase [Chengkuizengella sediminis]|uniref:aldehyde dehydrogenase n=1 Tax=Chengkuizengella sediminis TaxID=1885917 RepID=UPI001389C80F|nr:aldehyde dehydrogenase [Chengkuizengella sediminis]NDI33168.1 aldehyde dehydrogenase [Chengkuizengella sediminis]